MAAAELAEDAAELCSFLEPGVSLVEALAEALALCASDLALLGGSGAEGEDGRPLGERAEAAIWYRLTRRLFFAAAQVAYAEGEKAPAVVDAVGELALRSGGLGADERRAQAVLRAHTAAARRAVESGMGAVASTCSGARRARGEALSWRGMSA